MADDEQVKRTVDDVLHAEPDKLADAVERLPENFEFTERQQEYFENDTSPNSEYRQFQFFPKPENITDDRFVPGVPLENVGGEKTGGYTVNIDSLAIRVGELSQVVDAVSAAATTFTSGGCGDLGPGRITAAVTKVGVEWDENLDKLQDKIGAMSTNLKKVIDGYYGDDQHAYQRLVGDSKAAFGEKYGKLKGE